jgi:hypothetical protein
MICTLEGSIGSREQGKATPENRINNRRTGRIGRRAGRK